MIQVCIAWRVSILDLCVTYFVTQAYDTEEKRNRKRTFLLFCVDQEVVYVHQVCVPKGRRSR